MNIVTICRTIVVLFAIALASSLGAQAFDPVEFFGEQAFTPDQADATAGTLRSALERAPDWISFSGSGDGSARECFVFGGEGLEIAPDGTHLSCEAMIDLGAAVIDAQVTLASVEKGADVAWDLRDLSNPDTFYVVNLKARNNGSFKLSVQVMTRNRLVDIPDSKREIETLQFPVAFSVSLHNGKLTAKVGDVDTAADVKFKSAVMPGLAASNKPAVFRDLSLQAHLHRDWINDAAARLEARKAMVRLREIATVGLLSGIQGYPYPEAAEKLAAYTKDELTAREQAGQLGVADAANALLEIARAHTDNPLAQHEAGIAALLAGHPAIGYERMKLAVKLNPEPVSQLALAESCRRVGEFTEAETAMNAAEGDLPEELAPDMALIRGRLLADRGDIQGAHRVLGEAYENYPEHAQLAAFADSAAVLVSPPTLRRLNAVGPLGLELLSDLEWTEIRPLIEKLEPYVKQIRKWLPELKDKLQGRIAIFAGPVQYLRAALLVAGDNLDHVAGMYMPHGIGGGPSVIACHAFGEDELLRTMVHELWHLALASTGRDSRLPRWLNEGMAVFLSAGTPGDEGMRFDSMPSEFRNVGSVGVTLDGDLIKRALEARPQSFYVPGEVRRNYLAAWAVVWYFAVREGDRDALSRMLKGEEAALNEPRQRENLAKAIAETMAARIKQS